MIQFAPEDLDIIYKYTQLWEMQIDKDREKRYDIRVKLCLGLYAFGRIIYGNNKE